MEEAAGRLLELLVDAAEEVVGRALKGDEAGVLRSLFEFLGVDATFGIDEEEAKKVVNPRPPVAKPDGVVDYLKETLYQQNQGLKTKLHPPLRKRLRADPASNHLICSSL